MSALHDELSARQSPVRCATCKFLASLSAGERNEWLSELKLATVTNAAIERALHKRGVAVSVNAVRNHRQFHG